MEANQSGGGKRMYDDRIGVDNEIYVVYLEETGEKQVKMITEKEGMD